MPKTCYVPKKFSAEHMAIIDLANDIITSYQAQGYDLTLRQLYYQMVSRGHIANKQSEYSRLGAIINDARLGGLIDWYAIIDRTRNVRGNSHWATPGDVIASAAASYARDKWEGQGYHVEVWIEKDALVGVIDQVCRRNDVQFFSCRGYTSASELWGAAQRMMLHQRAGKVPVVIHLGDHDPSGIDMTRDITDRLALFCRHHGYRAPQVDRIALTMAQIEQYDPPPNPAKTTDARFAGYAETYGDESWELDALEPSVLDALIQRHIVKYRNQGAWDRIVETERQERALLNVTSKQWPFVAEYVTKLDPYAIEDSVREEIAADEGDEPGDDEEDVAFCGRCNRGFKSEHAFNDHECDGDDW